MNNNLDYIIPPVDRDLIKRELNQERFVRDTNKGGHKIYVINYHNSPNVMREIGRLREVSFAQAGGGTGLEIDIDENDTSENCYEQLIVYSETDEEIIGGYRFIDCSKIDLSNKEDIELSTAHYFNFSDKFIKEYLPYTIELGRSWIQPKYQPTTNPREGIFALDNLWDGLGAIVVNTPNAKYFFGKVTMYSNYNKEARDAVLQFMLHFFPDDENLVTPISPLEPITDAKEIKAMFEGKSYKDATIVLNRFTKERGERVPPLIKNYMHLSPTMKTFGTASNPDFGGVEETGILITIDDIYASKRERHTNY